MKVVFSILLIIVSVIMFFILKKKYRLTPQQIQIFVLLVLFWLSVGMIRDYRKRYAITEIVKGGLGLSPLIAANIAAGYGLISAIIRLPIFFISDYLNKRKLLIQIALVMLFCSGVYVYTQPTANSLYLSSLAMGLSASLLAMFNVVFSATFKKEQAMLSVSILSIAPLIAEAISSSFQYFILKYTSSMRILWLFSIIFAMIALVVTFKMNELQYSQKQFTKQNIIELFKNKRYLVICGIAIFISFIRFATSGANLNSYAKIIGMDEFLIAFIDVVFSLSQLIAGVLMGTYIQKRIGSKNTLSLGLIFSLIYIITLVLTTNPIIIFSMYVFHGLGYGMCYNCLIGLAIEPFEKSQRHLSMGFFQMFFAIGIFYGDKVYAIIYQYIPSGFLSFNFNQAIFIFAIAILLSLLILLNIIKYERK